jgi:hypothetical protein
MAAKMFTLYSTASFIFPYIHIKTKVFRLSAATCSMFDTQMSFAKKTVSHREPIIWKKNCYGKKGDSEAVTHSPKR